MLSGDKKSVTLPAIPIRQPIGEFFIGVIQAKDLVDISWADIREMENELDSYMGIQRRLSKPRVKELSSYVNTYDATFPTSVILAVDEQNALWDEEKSHITLIATDDIPFEKVARIIDGQHRVEGLKALEDHDFEINISIFVGADVATQANIFATVNLAQTKVNRSLVYDLLDYENKRSPQKSAHDIAIALDRIPDSPFYERIKRLGIATYGRENETLTQAAVVEPLLGLITDDPMGDRDNILRKIGLSRPSTDVLLRRPFRGLFIQDRDADITRIMIAYFSAVRNKWPKSWSNANRQGNVLPKTNGFRALMRILKLCYIDIVKGDFSTVPSETQFMEKINKVNLQDEDFNIETFPPGTSGEARLFNILINDTFPEKAASNQKTLFD